MNYLNHKLNKKLYCCFCSKHYSEIIKDLTNEEAELGNHIETFEEIFIFINSILNCMTEEEYLIKSIIE